MNWTPYEEKQLIQLRAKGKTTREIANALHRSYESIEHKILRLGLEFKREEKKKKERIGFLDIETTGFNPEFDHVITWCIKELHGKIYNASITVKDLQTEKYDKNVLIKLLEDLDDFDRIVVHYGTDRKFDIPFLRSRSEQLRLPFPEYKFMHVSDTHTILKNKFKLRSNSLRSASRFFDIDAKDHPMTEKVWRRFYSCNPKLIEQSLKYVMIHNKEDVISTEKLWLRIYKYANFNNQSI